MPVGYWCSVAVVSWGVACALTRWRRLGGVSEIPALVVSEMPFIAGYLLVASTVLALVQGDLGSPGGAAGAAVALLDLAGLTVIVRRALRAHAVLGNSGQPRRPWARILRAPLLPGRPGVARQRGLAYGEGRHRTLDVYYRRDRPAGAPVLLNLHGGGFCSGSKAREARPLIRYLTSRRDFVCVSADYRLQPRVTLADQVADVRAAIAWARAHAADFSTGPGPLFVTGSSAGANLAIRAVCEGETGIAGLICRYGYYGDLTPEGDIPPMLIVHGGHDMLVPAAAAHAFADRARAVSAHPVRYAELPGAHHDFDLRESIRSAAVCTAVGQFTAEIAQFTAEVARPPTAEPGRDSLR
jgi:acetyl esterase/lipase